MIVLFLVGGRSGYSKWSFMPEGKNPYFENNESPLLTFCKSKVTIEDLYRKELIERYQPLFYAHTLTYTHTHTHGFQPKLV